MHAALARHGTEGGGIWLEGTAGMGQRLRRFTPQDRHECQPLAGSDGSLVLVSDARIDNRMELIGELISCGRLRTGTAAEDGIPDSALILYAYEAWGQDSVRRLVGVFSFAIWDKRSRRLFAARSPIVAPDLVYHVSPDTFCFSTMPAGLHALPFAPRLLNEDRFAQLLTPIVLSPPEDTLYLGIYRLPTGFSLTADAGGVKTCRYWRPDLKKEIRFSRDEEYIEAFNDLFTRVVGDHLCSLTPVSVQMSGGLDSSSVAATAARLMSARGERLTAFTEVPSPGFTGQVPTGRYADETPFVEAIAAMYNNLDLALTRTDGQFFLDDIDSLFQGLEAPFPSASNRVWMEAIIRETARQGRRVILDGMQGNLTMSWKGSGLLPALIQSGKWSRAYREARAYGRQNVIKRSALRVLIGQGVLPLLPDPLWIAVERLRNPAARKDAPWLIYSSIHPDFAAARKIPERAREHNFFLRFRAHADSKRMRCEALSDQDFGAYLCANRAMYGVDMRTPPADVRLAEFCLSLPENQYMRDGEPRRLMRRAMTPYLPTPILTSRLRGLQAADWFERMSGARSRIGSELNLLDQSDLARRILDLQKMRGLFDRMPEPGTLHDDAFGDYYLVFQQGLMLGRFLRWFETGV
jgi:asparagine synthase (glutamine-hydrolysing)